MTSKASIEALNGLHGLVATELAKRIKDGTATSADISAAIKFLKDNGVEQAAIPGSPTADLAATLPFAGTDSFNQFHQ